MYKLTRSDSGWEESVLWNFGNGSDGWQPASELIMDRDGNLYGTTTSGGTYNYGIVFELSPSLYGWEEEILYNFQNGSDGATPYAGLISDQSGNLYGATIRGSGEQNRATVFELTHSGESWIFHVLYTFENGSGGVQSTLLQDTAGNLYGATRAGGPYGDGSVFRLTKSSGTWIYTDLHDFDEADGSIPMGGLVFGVDGNLYGTTDDGAPYQCEFGFTCGVIWEITP